MTEPSLPKADKRTGKPTAHETGMVNLSETVDCPLCGGRGQLARMEFYEKTGMREPSLIADLSAKQAVQSMHDRLWGDFREQLSEQVSARTQDLNKSIQDLTSEKRGLLQDVEQLKKARESELEQVRREQENKDREALLKERAELQDELAKLKGQVEEANATLEAAGKQRNIDIQDALTKLKEEEARAREELKERIDQMNKGLEEERKAKAQLETELERAKSEVKQREFEARQAEIERQEKLVEEKLQSKEAEREALQRELAELREQAKLFPKQEELAVRGAIQNLEKQLHTKELDLQNLTKERNALENDLVEAQRKLEATKGKVEERTFEQLMNDVPGIWIENNSRKGKSGDFHVGLTGPDGEAIKGSHVVVDNKDKKQLRDEDIVKLIGDAQKHKSALAAMVLKDESTMRRKEKIKRFDFNDGVYVLFTTREWFVRDLDLLRPLMRMQSEHGPDFLKQRISGIAAEVRSRLEALDAIDNSMRLAAGHIETAKDGLKGWRDTIDDLCRAAIAGNNLEVGDDE